MEVNKSRLNFRVPPEKFEDIKWVIRNHNSRTGNTLAKDKKDTEQLYTRTRQTTKYERQPF